MIRTITKWLYGPSIIPPTTFAFWSKQHGDYVLLPDNFQFIQGSGVFYSNQKIIPRGFTTK